MLLHHVQVMQQLDYPDSLDSKSVQVLTEATAKKLWLASYITISTCTDYVDNSYKL